MHMLGFSCTEPLTQLKPKCKERLFESLLFSNNVSILVFDDKLYKLHKLFQEQINCAGQGFDQMTDDDMIEMVLTVEAPFFNAKHKAVSIVAKCT